MPRRIMTDEEKRLADQIHQAIQWQTNNSSRSQQSHQFRMGVSDIGTCHERARRLLAQIPMETEPEKLEAFLGTAIGEAIEQALAVKWPDAVFQASLSTEIKVGKDSFLITGHPDILLPWGAGDGKTVHGTAGVERTGPTDQQLFQRHIYAKMGMEAGIITVDPWDCRTFNFWTDRAGQDKDPYVHMDYYSEDVIAAAGLWLEEVFHAYDLGIEAEKDPPRQWCKAACGHFDSCRKFDSDVSGLIESKVIAEAATMHEEGTKLAKEGDRLKKAANSTLRGIDGYTKEHQIRWVHVNASSDGTRSGYDRLEVTRVRTLDASNDTTQQEEA